MRQQFPRACVLVKAFVVRVRRSVTQQLCLIARVQHVSQSRMPLFHPKSWVLVSFLLSWETLIRVLTIEVKVCRIGGFQVLTK